MNDVILSILLAVMLDGQVPLPPPPDLAIPPFAGQPALPSVGVSTLPPLQEMVKTPPPPQETMSATVRVEAAKPPSFRLIEAPLPSTSTSSPSLKSTPRAAVEPLASGGVLTPCLLLARTVPTNPKTGEPFCYEIVVRNAGSVPVAQVTLEEELPPGSNFVGAQPTPLAQGQRLSWLLENLAPGAERRVKIEVTAGREGDWKATASLTVTVSSAMNIIVAGGPQPAPTMPQPQLVNAEPALSIIGPSTLPVGHPVVLFMRVTNTTGSILSDASVRVQMSSGLQHLQGNAIEGSLGTLAPGQSKDLTLEAFAMQTGKLSAEATLLSGTKTVANAQTAVLATDQPTLAIHQTGPLAPPAGSEHEFKLAVTNRSSAEVKDVRVSDVLPEGLQFVNGDGGAVFDAATRTIAWNLGTLQPGQTRNVVFRGRVRGVGPQVNRIGARGAGVPEAQLNSILRLGESN